MRLTGELGRTIHVQRDFTSEDHIVIKITEDGEFFGVWVYLTEAQARRTAEYLQELADQLGVWNE